MMMMMMMMMKRHRYHRISELIEPSYGLNPIKFGRMWMKHTNNALSSNKSHGAIWWMRLVSIVIHFVIKPGWSSFISPFRFTPLWFRIDGTGLPQVDLRWRRRKTLFLSSSRGCAFWDAHRRTTVSSVKIWLIDGRTDGGRTDGHTHTAVYKTQCTPSRKSFSSNHYS